MNKGTTVYKIKNKTTKKFLKIVEEKLLWVCNRKDASCMSLEQHTTLKDAKNILSNIFKSSGYDICDIEFIEINYD